VGSKFEKRRGENKIFGRGGGILFLSSNMLVCRRRRRRERRWTVGSQARTVLQLEARTRTGCHKFAIFSVRRK
jgi:hypothetical protein